MYKSAIALAASAFFSTSLLANGMVDYLQVDGDIVVFGTSGDKTNASPACAAGDKWTVNLATDSGKANYALLMSAMSGKLSVEVGSAGDCADNATIERAQSVTINGSTADVDLPTYYVSCADILRQNPGASDGVYVIDPDLVGPSLPFKAYCDMTNDGGGWTLVMRAKEGDTAGWHTSGFLNFQRATNPDGGTFKYSDALMNSLYTSDFRINPLGYVGNHPYFFRTQYDHFQKITNNVPNNVSAGPGGSLVFSGEKVRSELTGFYFYKAYNQIHIATNVVSGSNFWYVGNGQEGQYANGKGEKGTLGILNLGTHTEEATFNMWVR